VRKLTKLEYDVALAITTKCLVEEKFCNDLEELTGSDFPVLSKSFDLLFNALLTFLEIPEEKRNKSGERILYCRDWIWDIYYEELRGLKQPSSELAKPFLDRIIQEHLEWEKLGTIIER